MHGRFIAFDLDGTLVDSRSAILGCFRHAQQTVGLEPVDDALIAARIGLPLRQMLTGLVADAVMADCLAAYSAAYPDWDRQHTVPFAGIVDALHALRDSGAVLAVTSSKSRVGVERVVREHDLGPLFSGLWGGDDVERGKPHPEMLERAMATVGIGPDQTLIVGDTTYDIGMGVGAGTRSLGVAWGMHDVQRLIDAGASAVVSDVAGLLPAIRVLS